MTSLTGRMDDRFYPDYRDNWDDLLFRDHILAAADPDMDVLDLGAGAGIIDCMNFKGRFRTVTGLDPDERVRHNPFLDTGIVGFSEHMPFESGSFDLVFSGNVLEHLSAPLTTFREVARVLRPGGRFLFKTPNRHHYMPMVAQLTPTGFHRYVNRLRGRAAVDTFPTLYRANTPRQIERLADQAGLVVNGIELVEGRPEYLRMTAPTYLLGLAYERLVNRFQALESFRVLMVGDLLLAPQD